MYLLEFHDEHTARYQTTHLYQGLEVALHIFRRCLENREAPNAIVRNLILLTNFLRTLSPGRINPLSIKKPMTLRT